MAYVPLSTVVSGNTILTSWGNQVKDNFAAGVPDLFTTKGDIAIASGNDAASRLGVGSDFQLAHAKASATLGIEYSSGVYAIATGGAQSISDNTNTKVQIATAVSDTYSFLDAANFRLTVPVGFPTRYYLVVASGAFAAHATAGKYRDIQIFRNTGAIVKQSGTQEVGGSLPTYLSTSFVVSLAAADYVEMWCLQQTSTSINISSNTLGLFMIR